ncbi:MAG: T9SS type A sorting domain-containing protein [Chitinophagaceae bacterium]|nr:MAG: T9SS type A sorting domain-containing protein [Chitinophagaceae bacterium]
MFKPATLLLMGIFSLTCATSQIISGRMKEVFKKTDIVPASAGIQGPWEITYGPDDSLWVTECSPTNGYRVLKVHTVNGGIRTILDLKSFTDAASTPDTKWQKAFTPGANIPSTSFTYPSYQGGLMGLAIHPEFATNPAKKFVYLAYGHDYITPQSTSGSDPKVTTLYEGETVYGNVFRTWVVRFTYVNNQLVNPVAICDSIRGSNDHNSGRLVIRPENGVNYLYYASGDMGAGQFDNKLRTNKAQFLNSYEGKILRFNLEEDGDAVQTPTAYNRWIPNSNPYNDSLGVQSAVWATGMRNNQGFAFDTVNGTPRMYGTSHGPFSDDELNLLEQNKNYGHPLVIGYAADGNYNNAKAGTQASVLPLIVNEAANAAAMGNYRDPVYSNYAAPAGNTSTPWSIQYIYTNQYYNATTPNGYAQDKNNYWASEGYSGLDLYSKSLIPGWKNSILITALKWGRVVRMKLNSDGTSIVQSAGADTVSYFQSQNRFRDLAISPDGKTLFVGMERSTTSSGPSAANPVVPSCLGCIHRYDFLGYNDNSGASTISTTIPVSAGKANACETENQVTINSDNNNLWVPITDGNSDIVAEIKANTNSLGLVTASVYKNSGTVRQDGNFRLYLDRSITITTQNTSASNISVRFYITDAELTALKNARNSSNVASGVTGTSNLGVFRSKDACRSRLQQGAGLVTGSAAAFGSNGHVLTVSIPVNATTSNTSTFYFANSGLAVLPTSLVKFDGQLVTNRVDLFWTSASEVRTSDFIVERSSDGVNFTEIGSRPANGNSSSTVNYAFTDRDILGQSSLVLYYRLKMVDSDGHYDYSNTILVSLSSVNGKLTVTPNPVTDVASVSASSVADAAANWKLVDNAGRVVLQGRVDLRKGNNFFSIPMKKLGAGIYILEMTGKGIQQQLKVQKL